MVEVFGELFCSYAVHDKATSFVWVQTQLVSLQITEKGVTKAKDEGYVLYHRDAFWEISTENLSSKSFSQTSKIFGNIHNLKQSAEQAEEQKMKTSTQNAQN